MIYFVCLVLLSDQIFQFILNYLIFCLRRMHDNANAAYASMSSDSLHLLKHSFHFSFFENHIKPTPYTIGTKYSPKLATSTIFLKSASIFLQIRCKDKPSLTISRSIIKSRFIHLLLVLLLSGQVELNPGPVSLNKSSTFSTNYPCGMSEKSERQSPCAPV